MKFVQYQICNKYDITHYTKKKKSASICINKRMSNDKKNNLM